MIDITTQQIEIINHIIVELRRESYKWVRQISGLDRFKTTNINIYIALKTRYTKTKEDIEAMIKIQQYRLNDITQDVCIACDGVFSRDELAQENDGLYCYGCSEQDPNEENFNQKEAEDRERDEALDNYDL